MRPFPAQPLPPSLTHIVGLSRAALGVPSLETYSNAGTAEAHGDSGGVSVVLVAGSEHPERIAQERKGLFGFTVHSSGRDTMSPGWGLAARASG